MGLMGIISTAKKVNSIKNSIKSKTSKNNEINKDRKSKTIPKIKNFKPLSKNQTEGVNDTSLSNKELRCNIDKTIMVINTVGLVMGLLFSTMTEQSINNSFIIALICSIIAGFLYRQVPKSKLSYTDIGNRRYIFSRQKAYAFSMCTMILFIISFVTGLKSFPCLCIYCLLGINIPLIAEYKSIKCLLLARSYVITCFVLLLISLIPGNYLKELFGVSSSISLLIFILLVIFTIGSMPEDFPKSICGVILFGVIGYTSFTIECFASFIFSYLIGILLYSILGKFEKSKFISFHIPFIGINDSTPKDFTDKITEVVNANKQLEELAFELGFYDDVLGTNNRENINKEINKENKEPNEKEQIENKENLVNDGSTEKVDEEYSFDLFNEENDESYR